MQVQQLIVGLFKQAFHKMFAKRCRILHTSRILKRRHKDPICVRAPSVGLVIVVPQFRNCVSGQWHIECSDYFGNHRQVYNITGRPEDLEIVNDVIYYLQTSPTG